MLAPTEVETISCFIPGANIQFAWDSTSLEAFKRCPRLYYYTMIEGWQPRGDNIHLRFGVEYHHALQDYEVFKAQGLNHNEALYAAIQQLCIRIFPWEPDPHTASEKKKSKDNLLRCVIDYLDKWVDDPASTIILDNESPAVEVSFRFELDWGVAYPAQPYLLCGHLDRIVNYADGVYVMDRKTGTALTPYFFDQFHPHNQMSLYSIAGRVVLESPIRGVIIDAVKVDERPEFGRHITYRTQDELDEWLHDLKVTLDTAERYASDDYWPMNDTACDKYGGCKFKQICQKSPAARENFLKADFVKLTEDEKWNPLKSR